MQVLQRYCVIALDEGAGGLVVEVAPLVADLAPLLGEGPPQPPAVARAGPGACLAALRSAIRSLVASRNRGLATISPSLVVRNRATPRSTPTDRPVGGSGTGSVSVTTITYQRRPSRFSCSVLTRPRTGRCWFALS